MPPCSPSPATTIPPHPYASPFRPVARSRKSAAPPTQLPAYPDTIAINHRLLISVFPAQSKDDRSSDSPTKSTSPFRKAQYPTHSGDDEREKAVLEMTHPFANGPVITRTTYRYPKPSTSGSPSTPSSQTRSRSSTSTSSSSTTRSGEDQDVYTFSLHGYDHTVQGRKPQSNERDGNRSGEEESKGEWLRYIPFCRDFGPFNLAQVWKFREFVNAYLKSPQFAGHPLCLVVSADEPDVKANAICLMALYAMMELNKHPSSIVAALADVEIKPFRCASDGRSVWYLNIQDILYGVYRAVDLGWINMNTFDELSYEYHEQVANGDLNLIGPFIAFATPVDRQYLYANDKSRSSSRSRHAPAGDRIVSDSSTKSTFSDGSPGRLPTAFRCVLDKFQEEGVQLVIRLNDKQYDKREIEMRGISHLDMEFEDGSNPSLETTRKFIKAVDKVISAGGKVAVHCKAGLGRTGALIGAYMIYKHDFSAGSAIGLMRIFRPGMVVGPQQVWLVESAAEFTKWAGADEYAKALAVTEAARVAESPTKTPRATPSVTSLRNFFSPTKPGISLVEHSTPGTRLRSPGQPRKTPAGNRIEKLPMSPSKERLPLAIPGTPTPVKASTVHHPYNLVPTPRRTRSERVDAGFLIPPVPSIPKQYRRTDKTANATRTPSRIPAPTKTPSKTPTRTPTRSPLTPSKSLSALAGDVFGFFNAGVKKQSSASVVPGSPLR